MFNLPFALMLLLCSLLHGVPMSLEDIFLPFQSRYRILVDPVLDRVLLDITTPSSTLQSALVSTTSALPLRVEWDKYVLKILPPVFHRRPETVRFQAFLLLPLSLEVIRKLQNTKGWFLRGRVDFLVRNMQVQVWYETESTFYLNQFYHDFMDLSRWLHQGIPPVMLTTYEDWITLMRDHLYDNFIGDIPSLQPIPNLKFSRRARSHAGSGVK